MNNNTLKLMALACLLSPALHAGETMSLFDGKTLDGWTTVRPEDAGVWSVVEGVITGGDGVHKVPHNSFLRTIEAYDDFEFRCLFRLTGDPSKGLINSGIQYRSAVDSEHMIGYQADIGEGYWGDIYDEKRRNRALVKGDTTVLRKILNPMGWNSYIIRCRGDRHETYINGVKVADYVETDPSIPAQGFIGIQLHSGGNAKIEISDITLTEI